MVCNYLSYCLDFSKQNLAKCFQAEFSYLPTLSHLREHEIFQAECGSPQLLKEPLANYRTAPEYSKQNNGNIRTC